ncbi:hypothetical protein V6N12_000269 [Hibiscus sabdariffa]|uniref:Uncharacterized protein n=1 Tax=Hibiscus sabdariffa TaxID=183260 RepID=A0ABR2AXA9_9ROSI
MTLCQPLWHANCRPASKAAILAVPNFVQDGVCCARPPSTRPRLLWMIRPIATACKIETTNHVEFCVTRQWSLLALINVDWFSKVGDLSGRYFEIISMQHRGMMNRDSYQQ